MLKNPGYLSSLQAFLGAKFTNQIGDIIMCHNLNHNLSQQHNWLDKSGMASCKVGKSITPKS
jgi:hypothetical protein